MTERQIKAAHTVVALSLLWLCGNALRLTILAVPPVIPRIHDDLDLTATQVGILTGLPSLMLALAAVPGSLLIARLGAVQAILAGLALNAVGSALRGAVPSILWLDGATLMMGAGVAIMQVSLPPLVRGWLPRRIGFATAVYTNGLLLGEVLPVWLTIPLVLPLVGGSWQWAFAVWGVPVAAIAIAVAALAPPLPTASAKPLAARRWWPDWNDSLIWRLGLMLGTVNALYFGSNAFLPDYLTSTGQAEWIGPALTALNVGQLPASLLLLATASRMDRAAWPYIVCGIAALLCVAGMVFGHGIGVVIAAFMLGFFGAGALILALTLPPLLSAPENLHRVTAAMFTISYSCAVIVPIIAGLSWDITGIPAMAFWPVALCCVLLCVFALSVKRVKPMT